MALQHSKRAQQMPEQNVLTKYQMSPHRLRLSLRAPSSRGVISMALLIHPQPILYTGISPWSAFSGALDWCLHQVLHLR